MVAEAGLDVSLTGSVSASVLQPGLRCPVDVLGDGAPSSPTDRCTLTGFAASATGSAKPVRPQRATLAGLITRSA